VTVSVTLACEEGSLPVAWQPYSPHIWVEDKARRLKAGVPEDIAFATQPQIALEQIRELLAQEAPQYCVLADAGYGIDYVFRQGQSDLGLHYLVASPLPSVSGLRAWRRCHPNPKAVWAARR
jgi:SRSO17 transposase